LFDNKISTIKEQTKEQSIIIDEKVNKIETKYDTELKEQRAESNKLTNRFIDIIADNPKSATA
jgi:hypothetical protein